PQFGRRKELLRIAKQFGNGQPQALGQRKHGFTHFTLRFTPYLLRLSRAPRHLTAPQGCWIRLAHVDKAAVPAPVRSLLRDLCQAPSRRYAAPPNKGPGAIDPTALAV
ncbi:MAG TPA: NUDIX domain-containing protein, partial [Burkholderiaceae bacterium]|nr:NUDIX domain-containing protein [Burkholderiaceae bacterium]